jgi:hypothetical protein
MAIAALLVSLSSGRTALAAFHRGDIIVSTVELVSVDPTNGAVYTGTIRQFAPDGSLVAQLFSTENGIASDLKFSPQGILHGAAGLNVLRFARDGSMLSPLVAPTGDPTDGVVSLAFTRAGVLFAPTQYGKVLKFGSDGSFQGVISAQTTDISWTDLSPDQCTLYLLMVQIGRLDVCGGTSLPPLSTQLGDFGRTLLTLPDGTLLASTNHSDMYRLRPDGSIMRHYATHAVAYGRDLSPNFVWVSLGSQFAKFDLQNDVIAVGPFNTGAGGIVGIAVVDADVAAIPTLFPLLLAFLALAVAVSALLRLRT